MDQNISAHPPWSQASLIAFRFFFIYFIFYVFPFPLTYIPYAGVLFQPLSDLSAYTIKEITKTFLGSPIVGTLNGSGDTSFQYAWFFLFLIYSSAGTIAWSFLDRKRNDYEKLLYWLFILLRYYLAIKMLSYGLDKFFKTQFPFPSLSRLNQTYGESSPMGLLWTFMGYSTTYNIFVGLGEVLGGVLLFFKRTRLLGALIVTIVMSHVAILNLSYDVPVKLLSLHLFAIAVFLMAPDMKRLAKFFLWNEVVEPQPIAPVYIGEKTRWAYMLGKGLLLAYILIPMTIVQMKEKQTLDKYLKTSNKPKSFDGEYVVETFFLNGEEIPPNKLFTRRWKRFLINERNASIQSTDGASITWLCHVNPGYKKMMLISPDLSTAGNFSLKEDGMTVTIEGIFYQDSLKVVAKRTSDNPYPLIDRGFHWVNEFPFNR